MGGTVNIGKKHFTAFGEPEIEIVPITWQEVEDCVRTIVGKINFEGTEIKTVVGLSRGGLVPGVMISHQLNAKFVPVVWQTRDDNVQWTNMIQTHNSEDVLIVDDLIDSGLTYEQIKVHAPKAKWAVMYNKRPDISVDFVAGNLYNDSRWLDFPWEKVL